MNCLYSQFVNEWALPLEKGPEAITRLSAWINGDMATARIPFPSDGLYVHCPIEVRVTDTTSASKATPRPFLDPTCRDGPTLYLNATLYRAYLRDPPCVDRYYEAFEWLMHEMGGRPHWAKNFQTLLGPEVERLYGDDLDQWLAVRREVDPDGMFLGEWHHRNLPITYPTTGLEPSAVRHLDAALPLQERERTRRRYGVIGEGDGIEWIGWRPSIATDKPRGRSESNNSINNNNAQPREASLSPPTTATSEESFDLLAKGEASVILPPAAQP